MMACCTTSSALARFPTIPRAMASSRRECAATARWNNSSVEVGIRGCGRPGFDTRGWGKSFARVAAFCRSILAAKSPFDRLRTEAKRAKEAIYWGNSLLLCRIPVPNSFANSLPLIQVPTPEHLAPRVYLEHLDHLWFQLTGTLCNLTCTHCFISCSPSNHSFEFLDYDKVLAALEESKRLGVKEYYFAGGETLLH